MTDEQALAMPRDRQRAFIAYQNRFIKDMERR